MFYYFYTTEYTNIQNYFNYFEVSVDEQHSPSFQGNIDVEE